MNGAKPVVGAEPGHLIPAVGGRTRVFAVLGHPVAHTLSPAMHNAAFAAAGADAVYVAFDVRPEQLGHVLPAMHAMGFGGVNLTVPLKEVAVPLVARLDESAVQMGAVNTLCFAPEGWVGHNTDGPGFLRAFEEAFGRTVSGLSVFVLGAGGGGRAVALACAGSGVRAISLADLDRTRARKLAKELEEQFLILPVCVAESPDEAAARAREADLIVQATPVGMKPQDPSPLPETAFRPNQYAFDLVYVYPETAFLRFARARGARVANGLGMLLHQGALAWELWMGRPAPLETMRSVLEKAVYGRSR